MTTTFFQTISRFFACSFVIWALGALPAYADKLSPEWTAARAKWNSVGDEIVNNFSVERYGALIEIYKSGKMPNGTPITDYDRASILANIKHVVEQKNPGNWSADRLASESNGISLQLLSLDFPPIMIKYGYFKKAADAGLTMGALIWANKNQTAFEKASSYEAKFILNQEAERYFKRALETNPNDWQKRDAEAGLAKVKQFKPDPNWPVFDTGDVWDREIDAIVSAAASPANNVSFVARCGSRPALYPAVNISQFVSLESRERKAKIDSALNAAFDPLSRDQFNKAVEASNTLRKWMVCIRGLELSDFGLSGNYFDAYTKVQMRKDAGHNLEDFINNKKDDMLEKRRDAAPISMFYDEKAKYNALIDKDDFSSKHMSLIDQRGAYGDAIEVRRAKGYSSPRATTERRPRTYSKPTVKTESAGDRYRRQLDAYKMCLHRVGDAAARSVGVYSRAALCEHLYPN